MESQDANRIVELPLHQIGDDSFQVCPLDFGFAADVA
jgi:hypothetical protein